MSSDGVSQGIRSGDALRVLVGNAELADVPAVTTGEMADRIMATTRESVNEARDNGDPREAYSRAAEYAAKLILEYYLADPKRVQDTDPYEAMKWDGYDLDPLGMTGFMWGWAVNAARAILELPPVPNPAILETGIQRVTK